MKRLLLASVAVWGFLISGSPIQKEQDLTTSSYDDEWNCIATLDDFLYQMVRIGLSDLGRDHELYNLSEIYPSYPWELVTEIPDSILRDSMNVLIRKTNIELTRENSEGMQNIWFRYTKITNFRNLEPHYYLMIFGEAYISYIVGTDQFSIIPSSPFDKNGKYYTDVQVRDLFATATGQIFGVNHPKENGINWDEGWNEKIPLFSVYNETKNRFEFFDIGLTYLTRQIGFDYVGLTPRYGVIISVSENIVWIYQQQDGLFSYSFLDSNLRHYETSFDGVVQRMVATAEDFLLFSQQKVEVQGGLGLELLPGELLKYFPASQRTEEIRVPNDTWPDYGTLLYTNSGDLWIGIHGYRRADGTWILKSPDRSAFVGLGRYSTTYNWAQPDLLFQSSNGFLWFSNDHWDTIGVNGTAWYDPVSDTGCWFTTEPASIVEDDNNILWMLIGDKIYKYDLSQ